LNPYELTVIINPNIGDEKALVLITKIEDKIKSLGGEVEKTDRLGMRKLAYPPKDAPKLQQAYYAIVFFKSPSSLPAQLNNYLRVIEDVVRHLIAKGTPQVLTEIEGSPIEGKAVEVGETKKEAETLGQP